MNINNNQDPPTFKALSRYANSQLTAQCIEQQKSKFMADTSPNGNSIKRTISPALQKQF